MYGETKNALHGELSKNVVVSESCPSALAPGVLPRILAPFAAPKRDVQEGREILSLPAYEWAAPISALRSRCVTQRI